MIEAMKWTEHKAARFQALRQTEARGETTIAERAELDALLADLDGDEADALRPVLERMHVQAMAMAEETASLDAKARDLLRIAEEEERLLTDARAHLDRLGGQRLDNPSLATRASHASRMR
jgi:hypothetical protein